MAKVKDLILGVDPGLTGALAFYTLAGGYLETVHDMPIGLPNKRAASPAQNCRYIDPYQLSLGLIEPRVERIRYAVIEKVHAMPRDGIVGSFSFGQGFGMVIGVLASFMVPIHLVDPGAWKSALGLGHVKEESINLANRLFCTNYGPQHKPEDLWPLKKHHGRAEAALLCHYAAVHLHKYNH